MKTPAIADVTVTKRPNPDHGKPWDDGRHPFEWVVTTTWTGVDRTDGVGYVVHDPRTADRLRKAIVAGVVFPDPGIGIDVHGQTYVAGRSTVMARRMNADLRKLGF